MRASWSVLLVSMACHAAAPIVADRDDANAPSAVEASAPVQGEGPRPPAIAPDAASACTPGEVLEAHVRVRKTWHETIGMMLPGPLELTVPKLGARKTLFADCAATGGGCGDCTRRPRPDGISCDLARTRVHVDIGVDDVGATYVELAQERDAIVARWTYGVMYDSADPPTHRTETLVRLPCAAKILFTP